MKTRIAAGGAACAGALILAAALVAVEVFCIVEAIKLGYSIFANGDHSTSTIAGFAVCALVALATIAGTVKRG